MEKSTRVTACGKRIHAIVQSRQFCFALALTDHLGHSWRHPQASRPRPRAPHPVSRAGQEKIRKKSSSDSPTILDQYFGRESGIASWSGTPVWRASRHATGASERPQWHPATLPSSVDAPVPKASTEPAGAVQRLREGAAWRLRRRRGVSELGR